jgi:hypothetical protein
MLSSHKITESEEKKKEEKEEKEEQESREEQEKGIEKLISNIDVLHKEMTNLGP